MGQVAVCIHVGGSLRARPNLPAPAPRPGCGAVWDVFLPRGCGVSLTALRRWCNAKKGIRNQPSLCTCDLCGGLSSSETSETLSSRTLRGLSVSQSVSSFKNLVVLLCVVHLFTN